MSRRSRKCVLGLWTFVWRSMKCVNRYRKWLQSSGVVWAKLSIFPDNYGNFNPCLHMFPGGIFWGGKVFPDVIFSINRIRNSWPYAIWINLLGFIDPQNQVFWYIHQNTALCWNSHPYKTLKWMYVKTRLTRHFSDKSCKRRYSHFGILWSHTKFELSMTSIDRVIVITSFPT